jgi:type II secretory pathway component PulJ
VAQYSGLKLLLLFALLLTLDDCQSPSRFQATQIAPLAEVAKLRGARERKRREAGKCEGRKSHAERNPELVALVKRLHRQKPKGGRMSLRAISAELATQGFLNENGRPFAAASVKSMLN